MKVYKNKRHPVEYKLEGLSAQELGDVESALLEYYNKFYDKQKNKKNDNVTYENVLKRVDSMLTAIDKSK